jgi:hypothetical protein
MLPRPTADDLYLRKVDALKPYFQLYKNWGYRDGPYGHHTKFELKSTESRWIQGFTDPLFRNLQQLDVQNATRMRRSDFKAKIEDASDTIDKIRMHGNPGQLTEGIGLIVTFMEANGELMKRLAKEDLLKHSNDVSTMFICLVAAARAIVLLSRSSVGEAQQVMQECFQVCFLDGDAAGPSSQTQPPQIFFQNALRRVYSGPRGGRYVKIRGQKLYIPTDSGAIKRATH